VILFQSGRGSLLFFFFERSSWVSGWRVKLLQDLRGNSFWDVAVYALDASTVDLTLSIYPWAKFRKTKGAIKMHAMLDLRGNLPAFLYIADGKVHDIKAAPYVPN